MTTRRTTLPGLLLSHGAVGKVVAWMRRGTVPAYVLPLGGWTAVVPAGPSLAAAPYEDGLAVLTARPVPGPLRLAIGFFVHDDRAVVVLHGRGARTPSRWVTWSRDTGAVVLPGHQPATPRDLLAAANLDASERPAVVRVLRSRSGTPQAMLQELIGALALPGAGMLDGTGVPLGEGAQLVTPTQTVVDRFDRHVGEDRQIRDEMGERR